MAGYPRGKTWTTTASAGTDKSLATAGASKAPIQQVPRPSSTAARVMWSTAMAKSTAAVGWPEAMSRVGLVEQAAMTTGAWAMKA